MALLFVIFFHFNPTFIMIYRCYYASYFKYSFSEVHFRMHFIRFNSSHFHTQDNFSGTYCVCKCVTFVRYFPHLCLLAVYRIISTPLFIRNICLNSYHVGFLLFFFFFRVCSIKNLMCQPWF